MFEKLGTPDFLIAAREKNGTTRFFGFPQTLLLFLLVFTVANFAQGVLLTPFLVVALYLDPALWEMMTSQEGKTPEAFLSEITAYLDTFMKEHSVVLIGTLFASVAAAVIAILFCRLIEKRSARSMALRGRYAPSSLLAGVLTGALLVCGAVLFAYCFGTVSVDFAGARRVPMLVVLVMGFVVQAFAEEVFFRGYLLTSVARVQPLSVGVLLSALFFALFHRTGEGMTPLGLLNLFLLGVLLALFTVRSGNLWGALALHATYLIGTGVLLGSPVDGQKVPSSFFSLTLAEGGTFLHGGALGLGGGLAMTCALTLGIAFLGMTKTREG